MEGHIVPESGESISFELGQIVATPGALTILEEAEVEPLELLQRHAQGDWGDMVEEDKRLNDEATKDGGRIFSSYNLPTEEKIWIITEANRSATTLLRPSEY